MWRFVGEILTGLMAAFDYSGAGTDPNPESVPESWSYYVHSHVVDVSMSQDFSGLADAEGNLYWLLCTATGRPATRMIWCSIRSTDWDGNERFAFPVVTSAPFMPFAPKYLIAGSIVVIQLNTTLTARSTADGSVVWSRDFRSEFPRDLSTLGGIAYGGEGRILALAGSAALALSGETGETIWRRDLREDPQQHVVIWGRLIVDEHGNLYFGKNVCDLPEPDPCGSFQNFIVSLDPDGLDRFEIAADRAFEPLAVAQERVVVGDSIWSYEVHPAGLLDAETGSLIAPLAGNLNSVVLSRDLGVYLQSSPKGDALVAFELGDGAIRWRFPLARGGSVLLTDAGNFLVSEKWSVLEISPRGELLRTTRLRPVSPRPSDPRCDEMEGVGLSRGRFFAHGCFNAAAYDLPGAPGEGLGWNSRYGNAQHENRPRVK